MWNNIKVYEEPVPRTKKIPHCTVKIEHCDMLPFSWVAQYILYHVLRNQMGLFANGIPVYI